MDLKRIEYEHLNLVHLGQNRDNLRALFNMVPEYIGGNTLASLETISFLRTVLCGVRVTIFWSRVI